MRDEHGFDIEAVIPESGWTLTPRARDKILKAAYYGFTGKSDHQHVARRISDAVGDDIKFYIKLAAMEITELEG